VTPNVFGPVEANTPEQLQLTMNTSLITPAGVYRGIVFIDAEESRDADPVHKVLPVSVGVTQTSVILAVPTGFESNSSIMSRGGPISLDNFAGRYAQGGIIPAGGAEIVLTTEILPPPPLDDFITNELTGATILSRGQVTVVGSTATQVTYTDTYTAALTYSGVAIYIPHGVTLYKAYLSYNSGDPNAAGYISAFQQAVNSIQFTQ